LPILLIDDLLVLIVKVRKGLMWATCAHGLGGAILQDFVLARWRYQDGDDES